MQTVTLQTSTSTVLDANGDGTATLGPTGSGEVWQAGYVIGVYCSTAVNEALAQGWAGSGPPNGFLGATTYGSSGDANTGPADLVTGQQLIIKWAGGDPGATAYVAVTGTRQVA